MSGVDGWRVAAPPHDHFTRDIKPPGRCPGCDHYHESQGKRACGFLGCENPIEPLLPWSMCDECYESVD